jgi:Transposase, Mutator family
VIEKLRGLRLTTAAELVETAVEETLAYYGFPEEHWRRIRTTDEIDKSFLLDLLFWRSTGDRVAKSRVRGCQLGRAAITVAPHWLHPCAVFQDDAAAIG